MIALVVVLVAAMIVLTCVLVIGQASVTRAVLAEQRRSSEAAQAAVSELAHLHAESVRAALDATAKSIESIASALRPVSFPMPDLEPDLPGADVMAGLQIPDDLADWTDYVIPPLDDRETVAMIPPGYDPGVELGIS